MQIQRACEPIRDRRGAVKIDNALSAHTHEQRAAEVQKMLQIFNQHQILFSGLAKADTHVKDDLFKPLASQLLQILRKKLINLAHQIVVFGRKLHILRISLHVHQHVSGVVAKRKRGKSEVCADVVDDTKAPI